eukprot:TRINITY_DN3864_c0_g1_i1.p1 TRINITY_DN3864_c0_g1~~TRINITY_DN3864_c0_g1_i1.p1  ORF type:complete len:639 (-),score=148.69 TRINITY_DN3864_c0_g1_i1:3-1919(-)
MHSLVKLLVIPPTEFDTKERQIRFPFMAGELFSLDIPFFIESLFEYSPQEDIKQEEEEDLTEPKMVNSIDMPNEDNPDENEEKVEDDCSNEILKEINQDKQDLEEIEKPTEIKFNEQDCQKETDEINKSNEVEDDDDKTVKNYSGKVEVFQEAEIKGIELLKFLLSFLELPKPLNYTSAGYFAKALSGILSKMPNEFGTYVFNNLNICFNLIKHTNMKSFSDTLVKLIILDSQIFDNLSHNFIKERKMIIDILITKFFQTNDYEDLENINYIFSELFSKQETINGQKQIISVFLKKKCLSQLFWKISSQEGYESQCCAQFLFNMLQAFCEKKQTQEPKENNEQNNDNLDIDIQIGLLSSIIEHFQEFINLLQRKNDTVINQIGQKNELFGKNKVKILEILTFVIEFANNQKNLENADLRDILKGVYKCMEEQKFLQICLNISKKFPWNNFAGLFIERIFKSIFESNNDNLYEQLFSQANLIDYLIEELQISEIKINSKLQSVITNGNRGFLIQISSKINELKNSENTNQKLKDILIQSDEKWKLFLTENLQNILDNQSKNLGGHNPRQQNILNDSETHDVEQNIEEIYNRFNIFFQNHNFTNDNDNEDDKEDNDNLNDQDKLGPLDYGDLLDLSLIHI